MLRGYVRMQAESHHITLRGETGRGPERQVVRAPSARTGYGPRVPRGIRFHGEKKKEKSMLATPRRPAAGAP